MANLPTTLTPLADGFDRSTTPRILRNDFGEGYAQRAVDGINYLKKKCTLSFIGTPTQIKVYTDFFDALGASNFTYTIPGDSSETKFIALGWSETSAGGANKKSLVVEIEKVFDNA